MKELIWVIICIMAFIPLRGVHAHTFVARACRAARRCAYARHFPQITLRSSGVIEMWCLRHRCLRGRMRYLSRGLSSLATELHPLRGFLLAASCTTHTPKRRLANEGVKKLVVSEREERRTV